MPSAAESSNPRYESSVFHGVFGQGREWLNDARTIGEGPVVVLCALQLRLLAHRVDAVDLLLAGLALAQQRQAQPVTGKRHADKDKEQR